MGIYHNICIRYTIYIDDGIDSIFAFLHLSTHSIVLDM